MRDYTYSDLNRRTYASQDRVGYERQLIGQQQKRNHIKAYDREAKAYDAKRRFYEHGYGGARERELLKLFSRGPRILYLALGTGRHLSFFAENRMEIIGVDISKGMLEVAKKKGLPFNDIHLIRSDAECLPFRKEIIDEVVCSRAFKFFPNPLMAFKETSRVLRRNGKIVLSLETSDPLWIRVGFKLKISRMGNPFEHRYRIKKIHSLLEQTKYRKLSTRCIIYFGKPFYQIACKYFPPLLKIMRKIDLHHRTGRNVMIVGIKDQ